MSRFDDYTPSMAYQDNVAAPFFRNHVDNQVLEQLSDIGICFDSTINNLVEMVARAEDAAEYVCVDEYCGLPVKPSDVIRCHKDRRIYCPICFHEHRKSCGHCQEAMIRMNVRYFG